MVPCERGRSGRLGAIARRVQTGVQTEAGGHIARQPSGSITFSVNSYPGEGANEGFKKELLTKKAL